MEYDIELQPRPKSPRLNATIAGYYNQKKDPNAPINNDFMRVEIHADILNGCSSSCVGCFIPRRNKQSNLKGLYEHLRDGEYYPDEVTIGPTDIFSAVNFDSIMEDEYLKKIYSISSIAYTSALEEPFEEIKRKLEIIWNLYDGIDRIPDIDFKIVMDIEKYLKDDVDNFNKKLELFKEGSVQFRVNYHEGMFSNITYNELSSRIKKDYNAPILIAPSYLNNNNKTDKVSQSIDKFNNELIKQELSTELQDVYTMFDASFSGYGCGNYSFYNNNLYISPFIFDGIIQREDSFKIDSLNEDTMLRNINLAEDMECEGCKWMMSCCERNVPMYMDSRNITKCVLPRKYMKSPSSGP